MSIQRNRTTEELVAESDGVLVAKFQDDTDASLANREGSALASTRVEAIAGQSTTAASIAPKKDADGQGPVAAVSAALGAVAGAAATYLAMKGDEPPPPPGHYTHPATHGSAPVVQNGDFKSDPSAGAPKPAEWANHGAPAAETHPAHLDPGGLDKHFDSHHIVDPVVAPDGTTTYDFGDHRLVLGQPDDLTHLSDGTSVYQDASTGHGLTLEGGDVSPPNGIEMGGNDIVHDTSFHSTQVSDYSTEPSVEHSIDVGGETLHTDY